MVISSILKTVTFVSMNDALLPIALKMMTSLWFEQVLTFKLAPLIVTELD